MTQKKNIHKIFKQKKNSIFLKTQNNIEIQNFEPQKMARAYACMKKSEYPPPPPGCYTRGICFEVLKRHKALSAWHLVSGNSKSSSSLWR